MKNHSLSAASNGTLRIPSLDGLRAISISMVLAAHVAGSIPALANRPLLVYTIFNGNRGVSVFFVISGFLITSLLLKEEVTGKISIRDFYVRRVFRIPPPFWVFLAVVAVLWKSGQLKRVGPIWASHSHFCVTISAATGGAGIVGPSVLKNSSIFSGRLLSFSLADADHFGSRRVLSLPRLQFGFFRMYCSRGNWGRSKTSCSTCA
jgi:Acyltransferase family